MKGRDRERDPLSFSAGSPPKWLQGPELDRVKPGIVFWASHMGTGIQALKSFSCFPKCIIVELDQK